MAATTRSSEWSAYLIQMTTGLIGPQVEIGATTWAVSLNANESLTTTIKKSSLPTGLDLSIWLAPNWAGILLMWRDVPVFAGPIISRPTENYNDISLQCGGIRTLLAKRLVAHEFTDWGQLPASSYAWFGLSLGTIAKYAVQASTGPKTGGALPISYPVPEQPGTNNDDHKRTYNGFDVQNLSCDAVLTKLSNVLNGPDIMFRPRLIDDSKVTWDMLTGTEGSPRIAQTTSFLWDTTASQGPVTNIDIVSTGTKITNRVYSVGAGKDQGTLITVSEDLSSLSKGFPLLETAVTVGSQSTDANIVRADGDGELHANLDMLREISMTVRVNGLYMLGSYWPGDSMQIYTKGWITFADGIHNCRLVAMSGDLTNSSDIKLNLQPE